MINIQETSQITKIYLVTNCFGDPNKIYIGKTKTNNRKNDHKKAYGVNIIFTYIDEINSLDRKDWKFLETFWINYFKFLGFEVLNQNNGGGGPITHNELTRQKISNSNKGRKYSQESKDKMSNSQKGREFSLETKSKIKKSKQNISQETKNKISEGNKGKIRSQKVKEKLSLIRQNISQNTKDKISKSLMKSIIQYDLEGNFIKEWSSATEVKNVLRISNSDISSACKGRIKTAGKFIWKYKN